ncbi:hypothetical protein SAMN05216489_04122 [Streptomyces sp. 3213]|uniref:hypothetical protein n=1 Tax=Streptomyces sp. 3213.3 TaxID=1855348 RepID=UPI00089A181D|nr:hypothetical protein [Streptomyces sp. 3213.3]SED68699.1 hypothetical protein SAMN05216489_04122 [Streptomyces sp. 3213] [Streptomyces sp. 3213.3]
MPRPTAAQLAYGSFTVIFSTLAMLLLSQTSSGLGIAVVAFAALALGLLVSLTVPQPKSRAAATARATAEAAPAPALVPQRRRVPVRRETVSAAVLSAEPVRERSTP